MVSEIHVHENENGKIISVYYYYNSGHVSNVDPTEFDPEEAKKLLEKGARILYLILRKIID